MSAAVRLVEMAGALSRAADLGYGQPFGEGLRVCLVAVALAERMGLSPDERRRVLYISLARHIGCTANAQEIADIAVDEIALREGGARLDLADRAGMLPHVLRHVSIVAPVSRRPLVLGRLLLGMDAIMASMASVCEAAVTLAGRLGLPTDTVALLPSFYERWDGRGYPGVVHGDALPRSVQAVQVAEAAESFRRVGGAATAKEMLQRRSGGVFADFVDLRSVNLGGHSRGVAALARDAARVARCTPEEVVSVGRAGLVHDIGRVAVSAGVWGKPGPLTSAEREAVRLHPYYTERVLSRPHRLADIGRLASLHHERLDGSGYFRGCHAGDQPRPARILAAADALRAKTEQRAYRAPMTLSQASSALRADVQAGRLDGDAVDAVLVAAGEARRHRRGAAGLTPREVEVVRLLARGSTKRMIARALVIATKTADAHVQHIYGKLGVSTRAGVALYAMQHGLLDPE